MGLILNPMVNLKKNEKRVLIYCIDEFTKTRDQLAAIHPSYALLLTLFDGVKSYEQVLKDFCYVMNEKYNEERKKFIDSQLAQIKDRLLKIDKLLIEIDDLSPKNQKLRYNPENFIIPFENVVVDPGNLRIDFPLSINFNVTTSCKMRCSYCYHPRYKMTDFISKERLNMLFEECARKGCEHITFSGGDPFNRDDLVEIIALAHDKGLDSFVSTKSYLDLGMCQRLKSAGLDHMQISLDSANPQMAARLTGMGDNFFEQILETVRNLKKVGIVVRLKSVLTAYNIDGLEEYFDLCRGLAVEYVQVVQYARSIWHHNDELFPTTKQLENANQTIIEYMAKYPNSFKLVGGDLQPNTINRKEACHDQSGLFTNRSVCNAGRFGITMLPNGEVSICEELPYVPEVILGDLNQQSIEEFWYSDPVLNFLTPPSQENFPEGIACRNCKEDQYQTCHKNISICLRDSFNYFRNLKSPDVRCPLAKVDNFRIA